MDGIKMQQRIYAGMGKAAARAGREYQSFRIVEPLDPYGQPITTLGCIFGEDGLFSRPVKYKLPSRLLWADGNLLEPRDVLVGPDGTFFVGDKQPLVPMQAVWCNETLDFVRPVYHGTSLDTVPVATQIPCFRQLKKVDQSSTTPSGAKSNATLVSAEWFVWTPLPQDTVRQGDTATDHLGRTFIVDTVDNTELGPLLTMKQADVNPIPQV